MVTILVPEYLYRLGEFHPGRAVAFDDTIRAVDTPEVLQARFPEALVRDLGSGSVLYPGFINAHVHLEFSANRATLRYGDFMEWLESVIEHRDELVDAADEETMAAACEEMLASGITAFGAISSFGADLAVCRRTPQRVVYFSELIGSNPAAADMLYGDFLRRVEESSESRPEERIVPAVAIHSPYATHPVLIRKALDLARLRNMPVSAHLLESSYEREWLEHGSGKFREFFLRFFKSAVPVSDIDRFLELFEGTPTLFVHCVHTTADERRRLADSGHSVAHCPRSNRLLGCGRLPIEEIRSPLALATDGYSSNWSLNLFDEMRAALMLHHRADPRILARRLLRCVTEDAATALKQEMGRIVPGAPADFAVVRLPHIPSRPEEIALHTILHTREAAETIIAGNSVRKS
ncbi:aminofutalosine deaminase family hydrolase [Nitratifractor sp.]